MSMEHCVMNKVELDLPQREGGTRFGPLHIARMTSQEAVELVRSSVEHQLPLDIAICNAHTVLTALDQPEFASTLNRMTLLNDGVGVGIAGRFLQGQKFPENLNGTDLTPKILSDIGLPLRIYLLGAQPKEVCMAKQHIESAYPQHKVVGFRNGFFDMNNCGDVCDQINEARADLLLVAMGNPRQENFIVQNRHRLNVSVTIGVGALFDFMSGTVMRAPNVVQSAGLEWLFRLLQEPRRLFQRYIVGIPRFVTEIVKLKMGWSNRHY